MKVSVSHNWPTKRLRFLTYKGRPEGWQAMIDQLNEVPFLPMEAIGERGQTDLSATRPVDEVSSGYTQFFNGDVIVAKITPCFENGKGALIQGMRQGIGYGTTELHVLRPAEEINGRFLYYVTVDPRFRMLGAACMTGAAGQQRVPEDFVRDFRVPVMPLAQQRAIADYLDRETERIDTLIVAKGQLLDLLVEKRRALISHAITRGLNSNVPLRDSGILEISKIPEHWKIVKLKYIALLKSGDFINSDAIMEEGEFPVFGGNGLRGFTSSFSHDGDYVLIGRQGALCGNINFATGRFWASEHAIVVTIQKDHNVRWLGTLLENMNLNQYSQSAAQPGLSVEFIANLNIPVPPVSEQNAIVSSLNDMMLRIDSISNSTEKTIAFLKERRAALIMAAVTGQIKVGGVA